MILTEVQLHKISVSYDNATSVLRDIKMKHLKGMDLKDMKTLENSVQHLECFLIKSARDKTENLSKLE